LLNYLRFLVVSISLLGAATANAQSRIALVVGNSNYGAVASLDNPLSDATLMARSLESAGFDVTLLTDVDQVTFKRGISKFGRELREAGKDATGLFYYAGHGVQSFGTNYLLPTDTELTDPADLDLVAVSAESVLRQMFSANNRTNIVILDACRNNPFTQIADFDDNGLAEMKAPTGTFLSYATAPGGVALDGLDGNSPYTKALADQMSEPGLDIEQVFKNVRVSVLETTGGLQTPWDTSSLTGEFNFVQAEPIDPEALAELQLWNSVQATRDPVQVMLFLRAYPDSAFSAEARVLLNQVLEAELTATAPAQQPAPAAPANQGPSERERLLFEQAQLIGDVASYQAYLTEFPRGVFAEFAQTEVAALKAKELNATQPAQQSVAVTPPVPQENATQEPANITFAQPLILGPKAIAGKSLAQIIKSSPLFPPVEGLPAEYWKEKTCSNCHKWERENLCVQAQVYLKLDAQRALTKEHPFGGSFKRSLKVWAAGGCQ